MEAYYCGFPFKLIVEYRSKTYYLKTFQEAKHFRAKVKAFWPLSGSKDLRHGGERPGQRKDRDRKR